MLTSSVALQEIPLISKYKKIPWDLIGPFFLVGIIYLMLAMVPLVKHGWNPTWFHKFGTAFVDVERRPQTAVMFQGNGYDGQFFYLMARDPFAIQGAGQFLDNAPYRYTRIGLSWCSRLICFLAGDSPMTLSWVFLLVNFLSVVLGTLAVSIWFRFHQRSGWFGCLYGFSSGLMVSFTYATAECLSLALLSWGIVGFYKSRKYWAGSLFAYAALTRETVLYGLFGGVLFPWVNHAKNKVSRLVFIFPFVSFFLWQLVIQNRFGKNYFSLDELKAQFLGFRQTFLVNGFASLAANLFNLSVIAYFSLLCLILFGGYQILRQKSIQVAIRDDGFVLMGLLITSSLALFYPHIVWAHPVNFVRVFSEIFFWAQIIQALTPNEFLFTATLVNALLGPVLLAWFSKL